MALTAKQQLFVHEYLVDLNAKQAAIRAGYSAKTAEQQASRLLSNVKVQDAVQEAMNERSKRTEITVDRVLQEYAKIGFFDARKLFDDNGKPLEISNLDDSTAAALVGLEVFEEYNGYGEDREFAGYTKKYKLADKKGALDSIARHLGMFVDTNKVELSGKVAHNHSHDLRKLSPEELKALERILTKSAADTG